ncbi:MAG: sulfopyruvate decarboxylase subunit alpha [Candidatus Omnitrophica bacterium]|nr:sulfopyruvate decarboxylase subunit alpha [Candidatus Omnitrophota bacterium]
MQTRTALEGFDFFTGVADSLVASLIEELSATGEYIPAAREDLAVGMASGAYLAGRRPCVLMQNSGLGYCLNPLTSLNLIYRIPLLLIVGWRGHDGADAPEHLVMGRHCRALLEQVGIPVFVPGPGGLDQAVAQAEGRMRSDRIPAAVLIRPGVLG